MTEYDISQVYPPREDTFLLIKAALNEVKPTDRVLEIGCGSGAVCEALLAPKLTALHSAPPTPNSPLIFAVDINPHAVYFTGLKGINTACSDLFENVYGTYDLILFNAPYLPTKENERLDDWLEYALDGGESGREVIERFLSQSPAHLSRYGRILLLISSLTGLEQTTELCKQNGYISLIVESEKTEDEEILYVLRITRDLCSI